MRRLAVLLFLLLARPPAAQAEERTAIVSIEWAGFQVGTVELRLDADGTDYRLSWRGRTTGWLDALFPFATDGTAVGRVHDADFRPTQFAGRSSGRYGERRWRVEFAANGRAATVEVPAEDLAEREPVPPELQTGPDPASLALTALRRAEPGLRLSARSFDGRRAFAFDLACAEAAVAAPPSELACSIRSELLAGASRRWREGSRGDGRESPTMVWLRRGDDGRLWPARLEASSRFGTIAARLVAPDKPPDAQ